MRTISILVLFVSISLSNLHAQARWSVDHNFRNLYGPTSTATPLHHFIQAHNHVGDTLHMRWRKTIRQNPPAAWGVNFADPERNTPNLALVDSLDFNFPDSSAWVTNKFVIGVNQNGAAGYGEYIFTVFELGYEADSIRIAYYVTVYSDVGLEESDVQTSLYPNPVQNKLYGFESPEDIKDLLLVSPDGKQMTPPSGMDVNGFYLDLSALNKGVYFLYYTRDREYITHKIIIE